MQYKGKNNAFKVTDQFYGEFIVDLNDIIMRHQRVEYDHLRLHEWEGEDGEEKLGIALLFLSGVSLDALAETGVAEAFLDEPTPTSVETYNQDLINRLETQFED